MAKLYDNLFIIDNEVADISAITGKKDLVISNMDQWKEFQQHKSIPKNLIIMPSLVQNWDSDSDTTFLGYELAYDYLRSIQDREPFNILFLNAVDRNRLLKLSGKFSVFTKRFPHVSVPESSKVVELVIPSLSKRKFDYLVNYCLLDVGILNDIMHDLKYPEKLTQALDTIERYQEIVNDQILQIARRLRTEGRKEKILKDLIAEISSLKGSLSEAQTEEKKKKLNYNVMVVEDHEESLKKIVNTFSRYFKNVAGFSSGTKAKSELKEDSLSYQALITDMELLVDGGGFDDLTQGIDLLEYCETKAPHITTRVITSSPKDALKRLTGKPSEHTIYKDPSSENLIPPFENLSQFVQLMEKEIGYRQDKFLNMKGPKISWWGKLLTRDLYILEMNDPEAYQNIWEKAISDAEDFIKGKFDDFEEKDKLSVQFVAVNDTTYRPERGFEIIERLLTHRLIALWFARKYGWGEFYYRGTSDIDVYSKLPGFKKGMITKSPRQYFQTFLGLSAEGASLKGSEEEVSKCKILYEDLFPVEEEWLTNSLGNNFDTIILREINPSFQEQFIEFFYEYTGDFISDNTSLSQAIKLLSDFYSNNVNSKLEPKLKTKLAKPFEVMMSFENLPDELKTKVREVGIKFFELK